MMITNLKSKKQEIHDILAPKRQKSQKVTIKAKNSAPVRKSKRIKEIFFDEEKENIVQCSEKSAEKFPDDQEKVKSNSMSI